MYVQSAYDEDTGKEWLQIEHQLTADIKKTDSVEFEISFTSEGDPWTDRVNLIAEDSAKCTVSINTADNRFWTPTSTDGYYQCTTNACAGTLTAQTDTTNDWKSGTDFIVDDDPDNPFCTAATNTDY